MSKPFNRIMDKSFTDFSLISEISEITDLSIEDKDSTENLNKQVRFNSDVNINGFLNSSVISDASLIESESKLSKFSQKIQNSENNSNSIKNKFCAVLDRNDKTISEYQNTSENRSKFSYKDDDINDNTSIWTSGTEISEDSVSYNDNIKQAEPSLFKTIDNLPSELSSETSTSVHSRFSKTQDQVDLSKPIVNSSRRLKEEIHNLEADLKCRQKSITSTAKELASKQLANQLNVKEKFHTVFETRAPVELTQPLNVKPNEELFPDLTRLSVGDESILANQQIKINAIRKRVGADKIKPKPQDGLSEPDLLEFFDPEKHVFKFRNLSKNCSNIKEFKPNSSLVDKRLWSIFRERDLLNQFP